MPDLAGIDHPKVVSYADVLSGAVVPGKRVAVIGAGGIGVDVSHFLTHDPADDLDDWMAHWGVGDPAVHPGGLTERKPRTPVREVRCCSARPRRSAPASARPPGWAHRAVLKQSGVVQVSGVTYDRVDDAGLHCTVDGEPRVLDVDHVVLCAGQESVRELYDDLRGRPGRDRAPDRRRRRGRRARRQARDRAGHPGRRRALMPAGRVSRWSHERSPG